MWQSFFGLDAPNGGPRPGGRGVSAKTEHSSTEIPQNVVAKWQSVVDIMAELIGVPSGLIMRVVEDNIEVLVSSNTEGNPYHPGDRERLPGSGLYCETVIRTRNRLLVPNALADPSWKDNPDVKLGMISYLGFPILLPDGKPFGTICVLDSRENAYSDTYIQLVGHFRDIVEGELELLYANAVLGEKYQRLSEAIDELKTLRGTLPICAYCKKIRDDEGYWQAVDAYMSAHTEASFSHGICPSCLEEHYGELDEG